MSMLAFGKKGIQRPLLFHCISHPRHTSPHLLWPSVQKMLALIICDGFRPGKKTMRMRRRGQEGRRPDQGRLG